MSNVFVIIKMCYVHNQWYDISCATLNMHILHCCKISSILRHCNMYIYIYIYYSLLCSACRWLPGAGTCCCNVLRKKVNKVTLDYILSPYLLIEHNGDALPKIRKLRLPFTLFLWALKALIIIG